jgi:topoisomerase-4 subunit A
VAAFGTRARAVGSGLRGGQSPRDEMLGAAALAPYRHARGRKGKPADIGFKPTLLLRD